MLSDHKIKRGYEEGSIIINPFNEEQVNPNSYDVRLGRNFWVMTDYDLTFDRNDIISNFQLVTVKSKPFFLKPRMFVLGHTEEFIGSVARFAPHIMTKSTPARCGVMIHLAAGFGDVGYCNRWTLEIVNLSPRMIELYPGERIAQIAWSEVGFVEQLYQGKYIQHVVESGWKAEDMLPKWPTPHSEV